MIEAHVAKRESGSASERRAALIEALRGRVGADMSRRTRVVRALARATVLLPIKDGTKGVMPYESDDTVVLPVFADEVAYKRFRPLGGSVAEVQGHRLPAIVSKAGLNGILLDGAGPAPMALSLNELLLGSGGVSPNVQARLVSREWIGPPLGLPDATLLEKIRLSCQRAGVMRAFLYASAPGARDPKRVAIGVVLPHDPEGRARRRAALVSQMEHLLRPLGAELAFLDGDEQEIFDVAYRLLG
jgi:hypothetical protein